MNSDLRLYAPATERNRVAILAVLRETLPTHGTVLEIASGTGEHAGFFASQLPHIQWQASDAEPRHVASCAAWTAGMANVLPPVCLDVHADAWPRADAVVCINMIHIAPWSACLALLAGAARTLAVGGALVVYGPFVRDGVPTAASNVAFDASLRERDPAWGVRSLTAVEQEAARRGLVLERVVEMPANNLSVVFRRGGETS